MLRAYTHIHFIIMKWSRYVSFEVIYLFATLTAYKGKLDYFKSHYGIIV